MSRMGIRIVEDRRQWESESARSSPMGIGLLRSSPMGIVEIVEIIANGVANGFGVGRLLVHDYCSKGKNG